MGRRLRWRLRLLLLFLPRTGSVPKREVIAHMRRMALNPKFPREALARCLTEFRLDGETPQLHVPHHECECALESR